MEKGRRKHGILCILYLAIILFITLISREPTLSRVTHLTPLWSYIRWIQGGTGKQILLNIALFIPLGFFLCGVFQIRQVLLLSALTSIAVEIVQFLTYRGMLDVDDILNNLIGAVLGILLLRFIERADDNRKAKRITSILLLAAGIAGCIVAVVPVAENNIDVKVIEQFDFEIESATVDEGKLILCGRCYTYDRKTPSYTLLLNGEPISNVISDETFTVETVNIENKEELQIQFNGYRPMPTGMWIKDGAIEYVAEEVVKPVGVPESAVLKAYSPEYQTYVYQDGMKLLWLIGWEGLDQNTVVFYHLHTNELEKLPENRKQYKFDNRGFRLGTEKEQESIGQYRAFEDIIPSDYNVTAVVVGFSTDGTITWRRSFRVK